MATHVLVTGGAGYVGSHACKALAAAGLSPVVIDNLSTGHREAVKWGPLVVADIGDVEALDRVFGEYRFSAIFHFAASAYVGESVTNPADYYRNNVRGLLTLLEAARHASVRRFVFSSSCATYGIPETLPVDEDCPQAPISPYGRTKLIGEWMLADFAVYGFRHVSLRYFNAAGADPDGDLVERHEPETHLVPRALLAAAGKATHLELLGTDHPTADGSCVRDYVHVTDLAEAHVAAYFYLMRGGASCSLNLGTGLGTSVLEVVGAVERVTGRRIALLPSAPRRGDPPALYADPTRARERLSFSPRLSSIETIVRTAAPAFIGEESHAA